MRNKRYSSGALKFYNSLKLLVLIAGVSTAQFAFSDNSSCSLSLKKYLSENRPQVLFNLAEDYDLENQVPVFPENIRTKYKLKLAGNKIRMTESGQFIANAIEKNPSARFIFVVDEKYQIYASIKNDELIHHSSLAGNHNVLFAGEFGVMKNTSNEFEIKLILNQSGHYQTPSGRTRWLIHLLNSSGAISNSLSVKEFDFPFGVEFPYQIYLDFGFKEDISREEMTRVILEKALADTSGEAGVLFKLVENMMGGRIMEQGLLNMLSEKSRTGNPRATKLLQKFIYSLKSKKLSPSNFIQFYSVQQAREKGYFYVPVKSFVEELVAKSFDSVENLEHFVELWKSIQR